MRDDLAAAEALEAYGKTNRMAAVAARGLGAGLVGTPKLIAERLRRYQEIGVDCPMMHFHPMLQGLERFAGEVMPLLGEASTSVRFQRQ